MSVIDWSNEKNEWLKRHRGVCFEQVVLLFEGEDVVDILEHPNQESYPGQKIAVVLIDDYAPGGHLKLPHLWPGQTPPPGWRRDRCILALSFPADKSRGGLLEPPALSLELEQVSVVHQPVEQRGHDDDVPEQFWPVLDHAV